MELSIGGGVKSSRSKGLQDFIIHHPEDNMSLRGAESSATKQSSLLSNVENFDDKTVSSVSKKFEQVSNNATLKTVEQTAGLPRSQGYLLPRNDMRKKAAFTLAEVLITLGIIGVVAALTLPTLISNYQKRVYVNQLKKSYSVLSNGFRLMMAHDGVTELKDTEAFSGMGTAVCGSIDGVANNILTNNCSSIREGLASVFSGIQLAPCDEPPIKYLNGNPLSTTDLNRKSTLTCVKFPDGSEIYGYRFIKSSGGTMGTFRLDINGPKNPNTVGRDIFVFFLFNDGIVIPYGSQKYSDYLIAQNPEYYANANITSMYWLTTEKADDKCATDDSSARGAMCAARVLEEDAMNY